MSNRRRQYRVTAEFDRLVRIELVGPKVRVPDVRMLDLSASGAGLVLPASTHGVLSGGDRIELRLLSEALSAPVRMFAMICHLDEAGREPKVGIEFESWREHRALLDSELKTLFNERETYRVDPSQKEPVGLRLIGGPTPSLLAISRTPGVRLGAPVEAQLRDISLSGLGVKLMGPISGAWSQIDYLQLEVRLPGEPAPMGVDVELRYLRPQADGIMLAGLLLPDDSNAAARRVLSAVTRYVMARQREVLRAGLDGDGSNAPVRPRPLIPGR